MRSLIVVTRRLLWIALVALTGGVILAWWRDRTASPTGAPAEWPPLAPEGAASSGPATAGPATATEPTPVPPEPASPTDTEPAGATAPEPAPPAAAEEPEPPTDAEPPAATALEPAPVGDAATPSWAPPAADGSCPEGFPVKAKESSRIFHVPGGRFYARTNPDRCYASAAAAEADGYRRSKS